MHSDLHCRFGIHGKDHRDVGRKISRHGMVVKAAYTPALATKQLWDRLTSLCLRYYLPLRATPRLDEITQRPTVSIRLW